MDAQALKIARRAGQPAAPLRARAGGRARRRLAWLAGLALAALPAFAAAFAIADDRGVESQWRAPPQRVVSLVPSLSEVVCALDACERLVGVDDFSNWPAPVRALPHLGGFEDANVERIVGLRPDVVLLARSARVAPRLEALGLRVIALETESLSDVQRALARLGLLLGREARAAALWRELDEGVARVAAALPPSARGQRVYFEVGSGPYAASASSFIGQLLARLGAVNVVPGALGPFPRLNPEFVVRADPQLIIIGDRNAIALGDRPGWAGISALRAGRVCRYGAAEADVLVRPGPRMVEAARLMADCLAQAGAPGAKAPR